MQLQVKDEMLCDNRRRNLESAVKILTQARDPFSPTDTLYRRVFGPLSPPPPTPHLPDTHTV